MAQQSVPYRTPLFDDKGRMTRVWVLYFESISSGIENITNVENVTVNQGQAAAFDDIPQRDVSSEIVNAMLQLGHTPRPIESDAGSGVDLSPFQPALVDIGTSVDWSTAQAPVDPLATLLLSETPTVSIPLDLSLILSDNSPLANGVSGTITIPKLTTANGSITVVNGVITAFVNPT